MIVEATQTHLAKETQPFALRKGIVSLNQLQDSLNTYYSFDVNELNDLLADYSKFKNDKHTVILLPGRGQVAQDYLNTVEFECQLRFPMKLDGVDPDKRLITDLTIYIPNAHYHSTFDEKAVTKWIADLDSDDFKTRESAQDSLRPMAQAAKLMLRDALSKSSSAEQRSRINQLLKPLKGFDRTELKIPKNIQLLDVDDLVSQYQSEIEKVGNRQLKKGEQESLTEWEQSGKTAIELARLHPYRSDLVPYFTKLLDPKQRPVIRSSAAVALGEIGYDAMSAVPTLKALEKSDTEVEDFRKTYRKVINQIYGALKPKISEEMKKQNSNIMKDIKELKQKSKNQ